MNQPMISFHFFFWKYEVILYFPTFLFWNMDTYNFTFLKIASRIYLFSLKSVAYQDGLQINKSRF